MIDIHEDDVFETTILIDAIAAGDISQRKGVHDLLALGMPVDLVERLDFSGHALTVRCWASERGEYPVRCYDVD